MADWGVMRTPFRGISMHPFKALMTPFGRICLTLPFEYSEHEEPTRKYVVDRHEACSLRLFFTLTPQAELMEYDVSGYGSGIAMLLERLLNNFDIPARVSQQYVEVPCTYESTVLAQFFLEMLCKVRIIRFSSTKSEILGCKHVLVLGRSHVQEGGCFIFSPRWSVHGNDKFSSFYILI